MIRKNLFAPLDHHSTWLIYASYDQLGRVCPHVASQLEQYLDLGLQIIVIDTSPSISDERGVLWERHAAIWFQRENSGYDFHSYREGLATLKNHNDGRLDNFSLIFANDSCYGPYTNLSKILVSMKQDSNSNCVYGMTDSNEHGYHLQSYWLFFKPEVVTLLTSFFAELPELQDRSDAIKKGELALSRYLIQHNIQLKAVCAIDKLIYRYIRRRKWLRILELFAVAN